MRKSVHHWQRIAAKWVRVPSKITNSAYAALRPQLVEQRGVPKRMPVQRIFPRLGQAVVPCLCTLVAAALVAHLRFPVETTTLVSLTPSSSSSLASAVSVSTSKSSSDRRKHNDNLTKTLAALRRELRLKEGKSRTLRQQALSPLVFFSCMYPAHMHGFSCPLARS